MIKLTKNYNTVSGWYKEMKRQGYSVPLQLCYTLSQLMKTKSISFSKAFKQLEKDRKITIADKTVILKL